MNQRRFDRPSRRQTLLAAAGGGSLLALGGLTPALARSAGVGVYDATEHGLVGDCRMKTYRNNRGHLYNPSKGPIMEGSDNTVPFRELISKVSRAGGGIIFLPPGNYLTGPIFLESNIILAGAGPNSTRISLKDGANASLIQNRLGGAEQGNAYGMGVIDLTLDGNRWGQTLDWYAHHPAERSDDPAQGEGQSHGIFFHRLSTSHDESIDSHTLIQNVRVEYSWSTGIHTKHHGGEVRVLNCHVKRAGGFGFSSGWDSITNNSTSEASEFAGFYMGHGQTNLYGCKAFNSGYMPAQGQRSGIIYAAHGAPGLIVENNGHGIVSNFRSQNNTGAGAELINCRNMMIQLHSDSNNMSATAEGRWHLIDMEYRSLADQRAAGIQDSDRKIYPETYSGLHIQGDSFGNMIDLLSVSSQAQGGTPQGWQKHALEISEGAWGNTIRVSHHAGKSNSGRGAGAVIKPGSSVKQSSILDSAGNQLGQTDLARQLANLQTKVETLEQQIAKMPKN